VTVTITAAAQPGTTPPSVALTITSTSSAQVTVQRQLPDGTAENVRTANGAPLTVSGTTKLVDAGAPYGQQLVYVANGATVSNSVVLVVNQPWLVHLAYPDRSVPIDIGTIEPLDRDIAQGTQWPMGGKYPIVVTDGTRHAPSGTITVLTEGLPDLAAIEQLLDDGSTLLLNIPSTLGWGIDWEYVAVGKLSEARIVQYGPESGRAWTLPYQVVQAPVGGTAGIGGGIGAPGSGNSGGGSSVPPGTRTWADLALEASTWTGAAAKYSSYAAAAAGGS
jgi:hypothetical protein